MDAGFGLASRSGSVITAIFPSRCRIADAPAGRGAMPHFRFGCIYYLKRVEGARGKSGGRGGRGGQVVRWSGKAGKGLGIRGWGLGKRGSPPRAAGRVVAKVGGDLGRVVFGPMSGR